ncbi:MAG: dihydrodipicolinate synthase family protein [Candidatus Solibacter usitatus]|nr:dihydrodipicolinate synthase family protein [Candidatus Solibacter usitatus]
MNWNGVIPAITTPFNTDLSVDYAFFARHCTWMIDSGCSGIVALGSLGEGATLSFDEKRGVLSTAVGAVGDRAPVVAGVSALSTAETVAIARMAADCGCSGLMVLPPYVYVGDWRESKAHVSAILRATPLSCMLYNNPIAYKTDFLPEQAAELLNEHANLEAIKESSADIRRIAALRVLAGDRLKILAGVDDLIFEAGLAGATGWIAGLVNAFPAESVELFDASIRGDRDRAFALYQWFLPLLRMDTVPKFVQLIKLAQQEAGMGSERVRPPRLELTGTEREAALAVIRAALASRP